MYVLSQRTNSVDKVEVGYCLSSLDWGEDIFF